MGITKIAFFFSKKYQIKQIKAWLFTLLVPMIYSHNTKNVQKKQKVKMGTNTFVGFKIWKHLQRKVVILEIAAHYTEK